MDEIFRLTTLENGFRIITRRMDSVETAAIGLWVDGGSRVEPARLSGAAHMIEHMLFKGTDTRSAEQIMSEIESAGGYINAHTGQDHTAYFARVLADNDDIGLAVDLIADMTRSSTFDTGQMELERQIILSEIGRSNDDPDSKLLDNFLAVSFDNHGLGRPILGNETTVGALKRSDLIDLMRDTYRPSSMILSAAGKVDHGRMVCLAHDYFGDFEADDPVNVSEHPVFAGGIANHHRDLDQSYVAMGLEGVSVLDGDYWAVRALVSILGDGMSSRLFQEVREKRGLCYAISSIGWHFRDTGVIGIYAATSPENVTEMMDVAAAEFVGLIVDGPTEKEIDRFRKRTKASLMMGLESCFGQAQQMALDLFHHGRYVTHREIMSKVDAVDVNDVRRVGKRLLAKADRQVVSMAGPVMVGGNCRWLGIGI